MLNHETALSSSPAANTALTPEMVALLAQDPALLAALLAQIAAAGTPDAPAVQPAVSTYPNAVQPSEDSISAETKPQPASPVAALRQEFAKLPFSGDRLADMQTLSDFVMHHLDSFSPAIAESFISSDVKNKYRLTADETKALIRTYREVYKTAKKSAEGRNGTSDSLPGDWYEIGDNGSLHYYPGLLAQYLAENANVIYTAGTYYRYNDGVFSAISRLQVQGMVQAHLIPRETRDNQVIDTTDQWQRRILHDHSELNTDTYVINLRNGLFDVNTKTLSEHTPKSLSTVRIPASCDTNATCPLFLKFLHQTFAGSDSQITLIQEIMGYLLVPTQRSQKAFIFLGRGATGKSVLLNTIRDILLGADNVSAVTWQQLSDRFRTAELFGKLANIFSDLPGTSISDTSLFKALTGDDAVTAEKKYCDPFSFLNQARLLFSCNSIPLTADTSDGFYRRLIIITCNNVVPESQRDPYLIDKLRAEADGILQFALEGLYRLMANEFHFSIFDENLDALDDYRRDSNPALAFAQDMLTTDPDAEIGSSELYAAFMQYLDDDKDLISQKKFSQNIQTIFPSIICTRDATRTKRIFRGITLRNAR